jgi:threonine dehydrogenase-like Zn-dependent dehydrogenase
MRRLLNVVAAKRFPFRELVTHPFALADLAAAYDLFSHQRDGVLKVALRP